MDISGNIYITATFYATVDFDPGVGVFSITSLGQSDIFVLKLDASGSFIWVKALRGPSITTSNSLVLDALGNIYLTGYFAQNVDFDPDAGIFNMVAVGNFDVFVCKLNNNGGFVWAKQVGSANGDEGNSITIDVLGNIYVAGYFGGNADFDPGISIFIMNSLYWDAFILKLDTNGNFIWAKRFGDGISNTYSEIESIILDAAGSIYTVGGFQATVDFDPSVGVFNLILPSSIRRGIFISKLDNNGNFVWAKKTGGATSNFDVASDIVKDNAENFYIVGSFSGISDFDVSDAGIYDLPAGGTNSDMFIAKYYECPNIVISPNTLPNAMISTPYSQLLTQTGLTGTLTWSVIPTMGLLPNGLSINATTGLISGTPTALGTRNITVKVTNGRCTETKGYAITTTCPTISINQTTLANGIIGVNYSQTNTQTGFSTACLWSVSSGNLPDGLSINANTGTILGVPTVLGNSNFTMQVEDLVSGCLQTKTYTISVSCPIITTANIVANNATVGVSYSLNAGIQSAGTTIYAVSPALPSGLSLNTGTGIITGIPTTLSLSTTYNVSVSINNGICSGTKSYTFAVEASTVINCTNITLLPTNPLLPIGQVGTFYSINLTVASPVAGVNYVFSTANLPAGLTLSSAGLLSGTPTKAIKTTIVIIVNVGNCPIMPTAYTLVVNDNPLTSVDNQLSNQIKVYPNPSKADFNVDFGSLNLGKSLVRVYDAQRKTVFTSDTEINNNTMKIALGNVASGIYLLEVNSKKGRVVKRLIKMD